MKKEQVKLALELLDNILEDMDKDAWEELKAAKETETRLQMLDVVDAMTLARTEIYKRLQQQEAA